MTIEHAVIAVGEHLAATVGAIDDVSPNRETSVAFERARAAARQLLPLSDDAEIDAVARTAVANVHGLGPLQQFMSDPTVNEIMVNNGGDIWVEREGRLSPAGQLEPEVTPRLIERILGPLGRRLDRLSPIVDARLPDGSRVCAVIPPIAIDGPCLDIRRFSVARRPLSDFATTAVVALVGRLIERRCNIVISGATSSGKTSLLNALASRVPPGERVVTLEDTAELNLDTTHVLRLETRQATIDGTSAVTMADLVRTALRLRPDRIVVGEIRGAEVIDMLQALNTGHRGSLSTCHANSPLDTVRRIEALVVQHVPNWPLAAVHDHVCSSIDCIVHVERTPAGARRIGQIVELARPGSASEHRVLTTGDIAVAEPTRGRS